MYKLKTVTDKSWLLVEEPSKTIGLLTENRNEFVLTSLGKKYKFLNKKELLSYFKYDIFSTRSNEEIETNKEFFVKGFPVKCDSPIEVENKNNNLPVFSKKNFSKVSYSAGYFCVRFPKSWMPVFCPKVSTLSKYKYVGPFKTKIEMREQLARLRGNK